MQRLIYIVTFLFLTIVSFSQEKYTDVIQKVVTGEGKVIIHQSQDITEMVNGVSIPSVTTASKKTKQIVDTIAIVADTTQIALTGKKVRSNGYRIQVYSGDNSRRGKNEAYAYGSRVKNAFGSIPVYINFISPHWVCRMGDFRTYEEASEYFRRVKAMGGFAEAVIVRSKITIRY